MNPQTCYEENIAEILSIDDNKIKKMTIPPENVSTEGQQLKIVTDDDKDALLERGLNPQFLEDLPVRVAAFTYAAAVYELDVQNVSDVKLQWETLKEEGYSLRKKIIREMEFAYRDNPLALMKLQEIKNGKGHKDMLLDLLELAILGRDFPEDLIKTNFNNSLLNRAKALHEEVTLAYAEMKVHDNKTSEARLIRDKAFTWLKEVMDEIREYGKFVFADDPAKLNNYVSEFYHEIGSNKKASKSEVEVTEEIID